MLRRHLTLLLVLSIIALQFVQGQRTSSGSSATKEKGAPRRRPGFREQKTHRARWTFKVRRAGRRKAVKGRNGPGGRRLLRSSKACPDSPRVSNSFALRSTGGSTASSINRHTNAKNALRNLLGHFESLDHNLKGHDPTRGDKWPCQLFHGYKDVQEEVVAFGWKKMKPCTHSIRPDTSLMNFSTPRDVFKTIRAFHDATASFGPSAARSYGLKWDNVRSAGVLDHEHEDKYRQCKFVRALGYRFNGRWAATALFTNYSLQSEPENRGILKEVITLDDANRATAIPITKAVCARKRKKRTFLREQTGTGILRMMKGHVEPGFFRFRKNGKSKTNMGQSLAIRHAVMQGNFEKEMVEDSDTFSNLAILLLPVVLSLVPIALFQDTSMITTVLYAIATDVVSVMPIAIKGLELVVYGSQRHYKANHFLFGIETGSPTSVASSWAAECDMKPFVRRKGTILLAVALSAMMFGVVLEFVARRCIHRRAFRKRWREGVWQEHEAFLRQVSKKELGLKRSNSVEVASPVPYPARGGLLGYYGG